MIQHGYWCNTRVWPTVCRYCGGSAFFFMCDCGSKVFFDSLGPPWPKHYCRKESNIFEDDITVLDDDMIVSNDDIAGQDDDAITTPDDSIYFEEIISNKIIKNSNKKDHPIIAIHAIGGNDILEIAGILREIKKSSNVYADHKIPTTSISKAFLGPLTSELMGQMTVHEGSLVDDDSQLKSYTFYIVRKKINKLIAKKGDIILISLRPIPVSKTKLCWYCFELKRLS